jgi:radical SAM protein with 4Fe4S-binding SPASM domain
VNNVKWLYENKGSCEIVIKIPGDLINEDQKKEFLDTFGDYCDRIFIENFAPCWPEFDVEKHTGIKITEGIYQQPIKPTDTCPYIFYSIAINADGLVSSCFLDWRRKLLLGDVKKVGLSTIWNSDEMNALRLQHLQGDRKKNPVCSQCGQLSHCLPDSIDQYRPSLLTQFNKLVPRVSEQIPGMIEKFSGCTIFSSMDCASGFTQVPLSERASEILAFTCLLGNFAITRLSQGFKNSPAIFQSLMKWFNVQQRMTTSHNHNPETGLAQQRAFTRQALNCGEHSGDRP